MEDVLDALAAPVAWLRESLGETLVTGSLGSAIGLFALASAAALVALLTIGFVLYTVLRWLSAPLERVVRWSVRDRGDAAIRTAAHRYLAIDAALTRLRRATGVTSGLSTPPDTRPRVRRRSAGSLSRAAAAIVRGASGVVAGIRATLVFAVRWLATPIGIYLALASLWVVFRPPVPEVADVVDSVSTGIEVATLAAWIAAVSALLALTAVALDHGLTSRRRGRNAYLRERALSSETRLAEMADVATSAARATDEAIDELTRQLPHTLDEAVRTGSRNTLHIVGDDVEKASKMMPGVLAPATSDASASLAAAVDALTALAPTLDDRVRLARQAPARARAFLWGLPFTSTPTGATGPRGIAATPAPGLLEQVGTRVATAAAQHPDDLSRVQRAVDDARETVWSRVWEGYVFLASAERFIGAVDDAHSPRGLWARVMSRFGG